MINFHLSYGLVLRVCKCRVHVCVGERDLCYELSGHMEMDKVKSGLQRTAAVITLRLFSRKLVRSSRLFQVQRMVKSDLSTKNKNSFRSHSSHWRCSILWKMHDMVNIFLQHACRAEFHTRFKLALIGTQHT